MPCKLYSGMMFIFYWIGSTLVILLPIAVVDDFIPGRTGRPLPIEFVVIGIVIGAGLGWLAWRDWKHERGI